VSGLGLAQQKRMSVHENVKTTHNFEVECQKIVGVKQGVIGLWEEGEIRDSFPSIESENDIFNLLSQVEIGTNAWIRSSTQFEQTVHGI
jgi:carbamate kinase